MYVLSSARSGGTAYCLNKAFELGIDYGGELHPSFVNAGVLGDPNNPFINVKQLHHETGIQPDYTPQTYVEALSDLNSPSKIYLAQIRFHTCLLENATAYLTRKNLINVFKSLINYQIKCDRLGFLGQQNDSLKVALAASIVEIRSICVMAQYCAINNKPLIWYEDEFSRSTDYTNFDTWPHKDVYLDQINKQLQNTYLKSLFPEFQYE